MIVPVLLAGGVGTRLWPLSRQARPKQFLPLIDEHTLLEQALRRVAGIDDVTAPLVVGRADHRFLIAEQLRRADAACGVILEPAGRNTAPAAAVAALEALDRYGEEVQLLVLPSDHVIGEPARFAQAVATGRDAAADGHLVTFGVAPTAPVTGYGYIRAGDEIAPDTHRIAAFVEKPDRSTAEAYLADGGYFWNSGIFLFPARTYLEALAQFAPDILEVVQAAYDSAQRDDDFLRLGAEAFEPCRADSIDYAVMEKTDGAVMVPLNAPWNDLGSWSAVAQASGADGRGNTVRGDVILEDSDNCLIHSDGRLVAALGLRDTVIVETADAILVADRAREQEVKSIVARLDGDGRSEATEHRQVFRPWGSYESIAQGERFQVKRIVVVPGGRLSLQKHHHRAEHWVVVQGTAKVIRDDDQLLLSENESTYIPLGAVHRLENPGKMDLVLIEVQSGSYLGEDDIVRFDDIYGRADVSEETLAKEKEKEQA